jgi:hypothetical protein
MNELISRKDLLDDVLEAALEVGDARNIGEETEVFQLQWESLEQIEFVTGLETRLKARGIKLSNAEDLQDVVLGASKGTIKGMVDGLLKDLPDIAQKSH